MKYLRIGLIVAGFSLAFGGCNGGGSAPTTPSSPPVSTPPPATSASVAVAINADVIDASFSKGSPAWKADWVARIRESAGVGGHIDFVRGTLSDATAGSFATVELGAEGISAAIGSNQIQGRTQHDVSMSLAFEWPRHVVSAELLVEVQFTDAFGNVSTVSRTSRVQVCVPTLVSPAENAVLDNSCEPDKGDNGLLWEFDWSDCSGADSYHVFIMLTGAGKPSFDVDSLVDSSYTVLSKVPIREQQRFNWFWRVQSRYGEFFSDWSPERKFSVEALNADCINP